MMSILAETKASNQEHQPNLGQTDRRFSTLKSQPHFTQMLVLSAQSE